jgi:CheY-like chemotaxis protein
VVLAQDGFEALARLETVADIDLVILDLDTPGKDGLMCSRRCAALARASRC